MCKEKRFEKSSRSTSKKSNRNKEVNQCDRTEDHSSDDELEISTVELEISTVGDDSSNDKWTVKLAILKKLVAFKIDTGAQCNVIPYDVIRNSGIQIRKSL